MEKLVHYFRNTLHLPGISPQNAIFGFLRTDKETFEIKNSIRLLFKIYLYESRKIKKTYAVE